MIGMLTLLAVSMLARPAVADPFRAGDVLRVTFDLGRGLAGNPPAVQTPYDGSFRIPEEADVFGVSVFVASGGGVNTFTARLFDGDRLLGTHTIPAPPVFGSPYGDYANFYFVSPSTLLRPFLSHQGAFVEPVAIDFRTFLNGNINGRVEFSMDSGQIAMRDNFRAELFLGRAVGAREAYGFRVLPDEDIPVPEPASLLLLGTGLAGIAIRARRRVRRGQP